MAVDQTHVRVTSISAGTPGPGCVILKEAASALCSPSASDGTPVTLMSQIMKTFERVVLKQP